MITEETKIIHVITEVLPVLPSFFILVHLMQQEITINNLYKGREEWYYTHLGNQRVFYSIKRY